MQINLGHVLSERNVYPYDADFGSFVLNDLVNYIGLSYFFCHSSNNFVYGAHDFSMIIWLNRSLIYFNCPNHPVRRNLTQFYSVVQMLFGYCIFQVWILLYNFRFVRSALVLHCAAM